MLLIIDTNTKNQDEIRVAVALLQSFLVKKYRIIFYPPDMKIKTVKLHRDFFVCDLREAKVQVVDCPMDWKPFPIDWNSAKIESFVEKMKDLNVEIEVSV